MEAFGNVAGALALTALGIACVVVLGCAAQFIFDAITGEVQL